MVHRTRILQELDTCSAMENARDVVDEVTFVLAWHLRAIATQIPGDDSRVRKTAANVEIGDELFDSLARVGLPSIADQKSNFVTGFQQVLQDVLTDRSRSSGQ